MSRPLIAAVFFLELTAVALLAVAVATGRFDQGPLFFGLLLGLLAAAGAALAWLLPARLATPSLTHGALVVGSLVFSFPFVWLVSTSFKYDEEIFVYPPRWLPAIPPAIEHSPYLNPAGLQWPNPLEQLPAARQIALQPFIETTLWQHAAPFAARRASPTLEAEKMRPILSQSLLTLAAQGIPAETWTQDSSVIAAALVSRVDSLLLDSAWKAVYRSVALRPLAIRDVYLDTYPVRQDDPTSPWRPTSGQISAIPQPGHQGSPTPLLVAYSFAAADYAALSAEWPLPVDADDFLGFTLPLRQDRSWHRLHLTLELDGIRYVPADPLYLGQHRWQEIGFKISALDPRDERDLGIWPLVPADDQEGVFSQEGRFRLILGFEQASRWAALWRKYTDAYRQAYIAAEHRWSYVFNSLYLSLMTIAGQLLSCSLVAYAFARLQWPGRDLLFGLLLATMMLPPQVTMIPVFMLFRLLGWYNSLKALWAPSFLGSAFFIFMLRQFMKAIPTDLEDAAKIDGCNLFGIYWRIILPLMKPALAAVCIFTFMGTWNDFMGPLIYLNDQRLYPLALGLFDFRSQYNSEFGMLMAASTLMTLPVIAIFFLAQKYFIQGVTLTGMKG